MGTPFSNANEYTMRAFVVVSSILAACRAEASLPLAAGYGYAGVAPYATHGAIAAAHATYGFAPAYAHAAYAAPVVAHAAPVVAQAAPVVAAAPVVKAVAAPAVPSVTSTQYRAGDEFGNNAFGYSNINSARQESGNEAGVTGSYSYVDEAGVHTRHYVADAYGFRVTGDNLPCPRCCSQKAQARCCSHQRFPLCCCWICCSRCFQWSCQRCYLDHHQA